MIDDTTAVGDDTTRDQYVDRVVEAQHRPGEFHMSTACLNKRHQFCRNPSKENRICECSCHDGDGPAQDTL